MSRHNESHLLKSAVELVVHLNKAADEELPKKLAGIVKTHAALAVASALIPVPGADVIAAATNIWTMYIRINKEINLPFSENILKSLATGIATNLGSAVIGSLIVGGALKLFPGIGSIGGAAVMGATIYGVTVAAGVVYMKALTKLLKAGSNEVINEQNLKEATEEILKNKNEIKSIINEGKDSFKENKQ